MKIYIVSVIFSDNTSKVKYAGTNEKKAYTSTTDQAYKFIVETWENESLISKSFVYNNN